MSRLRSEESGFTLVELLVATTLMLVMLGATLGTLERFNATARLNQIQNDSQEATRVAIDKAARGIRNAGASTTTNPQGIEIAAGYDFVYQDVSSTGTAGGLNERNIRRVRYCLEPTTTGGASLWRQVQTFPGAARPAMPSVATCPSSEWPERERVASDLVNRLGGLDRPVFVYDSSDPSTLSRLRIQLFLDVNPGKRPRESRLDTAVILRNAGRAPTAAFTWTPRNATTVILNASGSDDPDGERLTYKWFEGATLIGSGLTLEHPIGVGQSKTVTLKVYDASGYEATATTTVTR